MIKKDKYRLLMLMALLLVACGQPTENSTTGFGEVANRPEQHGADG